jgi:hypothetical protein
LLPGSRRLGAATGSDQLSASETRPSSVDGGPQPQIGDDDPHKIEHELDPEEDRLGL